MKPQVSRQIFEKYSNIKFHEDPSSGSRVVPCERAERRTGRHEEANSRFSQFCERYKVNRTVRQLTETLKVYRRGHSAQHWTNPIEFVGKYVDQLHRRNVLSRDNWIIQKAFTLCSQITTSTKRINRWSLPNTSTARSRAKEAELCPQNVSIYSMWSLQ
jgi:hypothetical protein